MKLIRFDANKQPFQPMEKQVIYFDASPISMKMCAFLSDDDKFTYVNVIPSNTDEDHPGYAKLIQGEHTLTGGSTYHVTGLDGFERDIWLCPVTLFVLGQYPKYLYVKKSTRTH